MENAGSVPSKKLVPLAGERRATSLVKEKYHSLLLGDWRRVPPLARAAVIESALAVDEKESDKWTVSHPDGNRTTS